MKKLLGVRTFFTISFCGRCRQPKAKFIKIHYNPYTAKNELLPLSIIYLCMTPDCCCYVDPKKLSTWKRVKSLKIK